MQLSMSKFNPERLRFTPGGGNAPVIVILGKRGTGKSFLVHDLMSYQRDIPVGTVISGTEEGNGFYAKLVPSAFIHTEYNSSIIENLVKRQKKALKKRNLEIEQYGHSDFDTRTFLIMEDCLYDNNWARDKWIRYLFLNGRHLDIMFVLPLQYNMGILPILRSNIDYSFLLRDCTTGGRKRLYENYAPVFPTFESFCQIMDKCTEHYEHLVVDNRSQSNKLHECVYWYKAQMPSRYRLCSPEYWEMSRRATRGEDDAVVMDEFGAVGIGLEYDANKFRRASMYQIDVHKRGR